MGRLLLYDIVLMNQLPEIQIIKKCFSGKSVTFQVWLVLDYLD
jgi:hypothetical protein